jgi:Recombinase
MARFERIRELHKGAVDSEYLKRREQDGWSLVALEWQRELEGESVAGAFYQETSFGLRVADDCIHLEEDPVEMQALTLMMDLIVADYPLSKVADELNKRGFKTRQGKHWNPVALFNLLPRLIEVGPRMFSTEEWDRRKKRLLWVG